MTEERYQQLLGRLLDDELSETEATELSMELRSHPLRLHEVRQQLELWDLFSQQQAQERDAAGFEAAWRMRLEAEADTARFVHDTLRHVQDQNSDLPSIQTSPDQCFNASGDQTIPFPKSPTRKFLYVALALVASVALILGITQWFVGFSMGKPTLMEIRGDGVWVGHGTNWISAYAGLTLQPGDALRTGTNGIAVVGFGMEPTTLRIGTMTDLTFASFESAKRLSLKTGSLEASVARQRALRPLIVTTPNASATVLGTRFTLEVGSGYTTLKVTEGAVRLADSADRKATSAIVLAGQSARVEAGTELASLPSTGWLLAEYWTNVPGSYHVNFLRLDPRYPNQPSTQTKIKHFEVPSNRGENFGALYRGFVHPDVTGKYTFWISAWEGAELFLSRDDQPQNKIQIAYAQTCGPLEWDKHQGQKSATLTLVAGRRYYIEAIQKQSTGSDHLAVAWQGPRREREIISGEFLSPFLNSNLSKEK